MSASFDLDHKWLANNPRFTDIADELSAHLKIDSRAHFNSYAREACRVWDKQFSSHPVGETSTLFNDLLEQVEQGGDNVIQTPWGGVVVTFHQHPQVEKYLVIRKGGYLALEKHELKDEHLEVREGSGLILSRETSEQPLGVVALAPGDRFHFAPGMEHCLIGTENLLVFERSTDPKGMDQDLIFIYEPDVPPPQLCSLP